MTQKSTLALLRAPRSPQLQQLARRTESLVLVVPSLDEALFLYGPPQLGTYGCAHTNQTRPFSTARPVLGRYLASYTI
jgi:hypothetical protein